MTDNDNSNQANQNTPDQPTDTEQPQQPSADQPVIVQKSEVNKESSVIAKISSIMLIIVGVVGGFMAGVFMLFASGCWTLKGAVPDCAQIMGLAPYLMSVASLFFTIPVAVSVFKNRTETAATTTSKTSLFIGFTIIIVLSILTFIFNLTA